MALETSSPVLVKQLGQIYGTGLCPPDWSLLQAALAVGYRIRQQCSLAVGHEFGTAPPLQPGARAVLTQITDWASKLTDASGAAIAVDDGSALVCVARSGSTAPALGARLDRETGICGQCARTGEIQVSLDIDSDQRADITAAQTLGVRSVIVVPIDGFERPVGILAVFSAAAHKFTPEDVLALVFLSGLTTKVTSGAPNEQQPAKPAMTMLPDSGSGGVPMNVGEENAQLQEDEARSPDGRKGRVGSIVLAMVAGILIGLGGALVYHVTGNRARHTPAGIAATPAPPAPADNRPAVRQVEHQTVNGKLLVTISLDQQVPYDAHRLNQPDRMYLDLHDARLTTQLAGKTLFVNEGGLRTIRLAQTQPDTVRIVLDLDKRFNYTVAQQNNPPSLTVQLTPAPARKPKRRTVKAKSGAPQQ